MSMTVGCFSRRENRLTSRNIIQAMLAVQETAHCRSWPKRSAATARTCCGTPLFSGPLGLPDRPRPPHRLGHRLTTSAMDGLGDRDVVSPPIDETRDPARSSADAVGAARQHCGAPDGIGLCQVTVRLPYATGAGPDRPALFPPAVWRR